MDGKRFDEIARSLGERTSRRGIFRLAGGGGLAALLAAFGLGAEDAEASRCTRRCRRRFDRGPKRRRCLRRCRAKPAPPISTNPSGGAAGTSCTTANDCRVGLTCAGPAGAKVCTACDACPGGTTCCVVGICDVINDSDVCI